MGGSLMGQTSTAVPSNGGEHDDERERVHDEKGVEVRKSVGERMPPGATRGTAGLESVDEWAL